MEAALLAPLGLVASTDQFIGDITLLEGLLTLVAIFISPVTFTAKLWVADMAGALFYHQVFPREVLLPAQFPTQIIVLQTALL